MIVEVSQFRLAPGTDEQAFLDTAERSQLGFLGRQDGFVSRTLLRAEDGSWNGRRSVRVPRRGQGRVEAFAGHPDVKAFETMLDPSTVTMSHWWLAKSW